MPIYVYRCPDCKAISERTRSVDLRRRIVECNSCATWFPGEPIIQSSGLVFRGDGWTKKTGGGRTQ